MSQPRPTDPIGSIGWTERTGGVLTARECLTLARPLLRGSSAFLPAVSRWCSGCTRDAGARSIRRAWCLPTPLARDAEVAAQDLLTPVLLNHSSRAYTWGAAIAALHGIAFDRELLYLAAMFHDTGTPSPGARRRLHGSQRRGGTRVHRQPRRACRYPRARRQTRSPCTTPPALASNPVPRPTSYLPAQPSMCSAYAATRYPMQSARASPRVPAVGLPSGNSPGFSEPRLSKSLMAAPGTCTASP